MPLTAQMADHDWDYALERKRERAQAIAEGRCPDCGDTGEIQYNHYEPDPERVESFPCRCVSLCVSLRDRSVA